MEPVSLLNIPIDSLIRIISWMPSDQVGGAVCACKAFCEAAATASDQIASELGMAPPLVRPGEGVSWRLHFIQRTSASRSTLASGSYHTLMATGEGLLLSWGGGEDIDDDEGLHILEGNNEGDSEGETDETDILQVLGHLGHGSPVGKSILIPTPVSALSEFRVVAVSIGGGGDINGLAVTACFSLAVTACGQAFSWGSGMFGQLGHGDNSDQLKPRAIEALGSKVLDATCGSYNGLALLATGEVFSWGKGAVGHPTSLGVEIGMDAIELFQMELFQMESNKGSRTFALLPRRIEGLAHERAVVIHGGGDHSNSSLAVSCPESEPTAESVPIGGAAGPIPDSNPLPNPCQLKELPGPLVRAP